jgi:hypothetical protein
VQVWAHGQFPFYGSEGPTWKRGQKNVLPPDLIIFLFFSSSLVVFFPWFRFFDKGYLSNHIIICLAGYFLGSPDWVGLNRQWRCGGIGGIRGSRFLRISGWSLFA